MGRHSGFIAAYAALANHDVNFVLVPEVPFGLDGPDGFLAHLRRRVDHHGHAVVVVAEGAGQDLLTTNGARDASGNARLADIGQLLRDRIVRDFEDAGSGPQPALRRSRVRDPQRARQPVRRGVLPAARPGRRARGDGRPYGDGGRPLARAVRPPADLAGHRQPQPGRPRRRPLDVRARGHRPAGAVRLTPRPRTFV